MVPRDRHAVGMTAQEARVMDRRGHERDTDAMVDGTLAAIGCRDLGQAEGRAVEAAWRDALALQRVAADRAEVDRGTVVTRVWRVWTAGGVS